MTMLATVAAALLGGAVGFLLGAVKALDLPFHALAPAEEATFAAAGALLGLLPALGGVIAVGLLPGPDGRPSLRWRPPFWTFSSSMLIAGATGFCVVSASAAA